MGKVYESVEKPEEFLPFHDDIFMESLWQDCVMTNRYDRERAALIASNSMTGTAGGTSRFIPADNSIREMSLQNNKDNRVQMVE